MIPLPYYNLLAEGLQAKDEVAEFGSVPGSFFSPDIVNPNSFNRQSAWPITVQSSMPREEQVHNICYSSVGANVVRAHERFPCGGRRSGH